MNVQVHLELGRVSNLPTVWSNVVAAGALTGASLTPSAALLFALAGFSALYIGGMYLNDACDAPVDARERPGRPIPSGRIGRSTVVRASIAWFAAGVLMIGAASVRSPSGGGIVWMPATLALLGCIVGYDLYHKGNRWGPLLMAACRALVYLAAGAALTGVPNPALWLGAALAFSWVAGLTAFAKQEGGTHSTRWPWPLALLALPALAALAGGHVSGVTAMLVVLLAACIIGARRWMRRRHPGDFPAAIGLLIAGVSVVDALAILGAGPAWSPLSVWWCLACAALTLGLQRRVAGT